MSYDITFKVKVDGTDQYVPIGCCGANITWNVRKIIELSTGLPWLNEENNGFCKDVIPKIATDWLNFIRTQKSTNRTKRKMGGVL